jgi:hypothetical protein
MKNHHVANLVLDGRPVLITLCERCGTALALDPSIDGKRHTFRLDGVYNGTILIMDYESESLWAGSTGESVNGPMKGTALPRLPLIQCTWGEWIETHHGTLVPDGKGEARDGHGAQYSPGCPHFTGAFVREGMSRTLLHIDERLPHNTLVLGVMLGGHSRCYPLPVLAQSGRVLNDTLSGVEIAVFCKPGSLMAIAFLRTLDDRCLTFRTDQDTIVDEDTGSRWDMSGLAVSGPLKGRQLNYVYSGIEDFYIWAAFRPETEIHGYKSTREDDGPRPEVT